MRITGKIARQMLEVLDELKEELKKEGKEKYQYAEWERKRERVKERLRKLPEYVEKAATMIAVEKKDWKAEERYVSQKKEEQRLQLCLQADGHRNKIVRCCRFLQQI